MSRVTWVAHRIVLFGATGFTGDLTARALVERGHSPLLAGRNAARLEAKAHELGGLDHVVADVARPESVLDLVEKGDVIVTTVGPFTKWGEPALRAAVEKGAHYVDSTGEPPFIREVFETWGPRAAEARVGLLTAMGYDYVPGNLAGALALRDAGPKATAVDVGYFAVGPMSAGGVSGGTRASLTGVLFEEGFRRRDGLLVHERAGLRHRSFGVAGRERAALSVGGSEHYALPAVHPGLRDVDVYLGWFGPGTAAISALSRTAGRVAATKPVKRAIGAGLGRVFKGSTGGPDAETRAKFTTVAVAEAKDARGDILTRAVIEGVNPYDFTGRMLAWAADRIVLGGLQGSGALGPADAFTLDVLQDGAREVGLRRVQ
jgi:short subunit dehydrogenase-like uncharacterized protein